MLERKLMYLNGKRSLIDELFRGSDLSIFATYANYHLYYEFLH